MNFDKDKLQVCLVQFANLFQGGSKVKMSTRSGEFFTLADLVENIGVDASRFYYLSKQADQHLDFDLDLAKSDKKENIYYYICLLYTSPSPRDGLLSRMPSSA